MAVVLRARFADHPGVRVEVSRFEDWSPPPGGVDLLYCAQAWHWVDEATRGRLAYDALRPGGTIALFGHGFIFADGRVKDAVEEVYRRLAPQLVRDPVPGTWFADELTGSGLFTDVYVEQFHTLVRFPTRRYLALVRTFSPHRMLDPDLREQVFDSVAEAVDRRGGFVDVDLATMLAVARRP
jgi:hypothetical protein